VWRIPSQCKTERDIKENIFGKHWFISDIIFQIGIKFFSNNNRYG
jgi:hypothetical protein